MNARTPEQRPLDSYLSEPASDRVAPPASMSPSVLPFDQRSPEDFERICVAVAQEVDGLRDVRLYGVPGQRQDGIDLVGLARNGRAVVYQARRWARFSEGDFRRAVDDYAKTSAFSAERFVVCVGTSARRTEMINELTRQRQTHEFDIDLYDQECLSDMLRRRGDLVRRFFGPEWERLFCGQAAIDFPERSVSDVLADALLRGPLDALGLTAVAVEAKRLDETQPREAAELYGQIAHALSKSDFAGFGATFRLQQAECSRRAGDLLDAVRVLSEVAWEYVAKGETHRVRTAASKLGDISKQPDAPAVATPLVRVLEATDRWLADPFYDMTDVAEAVAELMSADAPGSCDAALWLAESALVSENPELIEKTESTLLAAITARSNINEADETAVRLRACLADVKGSWDSLRDQALKGRLGHRQATIVHARIGRYGAWHDQPQEADTSYRLAVSQACQAGLGAEAAAALRSVGEVGVRYNLGNEWTGAFELARDVQVAGTDYLRLGYDHRLAGLGELSDDELPSAHADLRANLRAAIVSGRLSSEMEAHELLGRLYVQARVGELAARHYIRAGKTKPVEALFSSLDSYLDCTDGLERSAPWERATTFAALAAEGDLIPGDQVERIVGVALESAGVQQGGLWGPSEWQYAYKLLAAVASRIPCCLADRTLDQLEPLIEREPNHYRFNDDEHVKIVVGLFETYPDLRGRTGPHLLALVGASPELGHRVISTGLDALLAGRNVVVDGLSELAEAGSKAALEALLHLEVEHPLVLKEARQLLDSSLNPPTRQNGVYGYGSILPRAAMFVRLLDVSERSQFAQAAMAVAEDETDVEFNRSEALQALRGVARDLADEDRDNLFDRAVMLATAPVLSEMDELERAGQHPLSRFRFDMGSGLLEPTAVRTAAALARDKAQAGVIVEAASRMLQGDSRVAANYAAWALSYLADEWVDIDVRLLASSPVESARQLAAVLWSRRPEQAPALGQAIASDSSRSVRSALAGSLQTLRKTRPDLANKLESTLAEDPSASVRAAVSC